MLKRNSNKKITPFKIFKWELKLNLGISREHCSLHHKDVSQQRLDIRKQYIYHAHLAY